jgi:hypothetical protein
MRLHPLHPDEPGLHHALRDALNERISNTGFFVWINVSPSGLQREYADLDRLVAGVQLWLDTLDPDRMSASEGVPEMAMFDPAAEVRVRALPKKPSARTVCARAVVGNPEPVLVGWEAA